MQKKQPNHRPPFPEIRIQRGKFDAARKAGSSIGELSHLAKKVLKQNKSDDPDAKAAVCHAMQAQARAVGNMSVLLDFSELLLQHARLDNLHDTSCAFSGLNEALRELKNWEKLAEVAIKEMAFGQENDLPATMGFGYGGLTLALQELESWDELLAVSRERIQFGEERNLEKEIHAGQAGVAKASTKLNLVRKTPIVPSPIVPDSTRITEKGDGMTLG